MFIVGVSKEASGPAADCPEQEDPWLRRGSARMINPSKFKVQNPKPLLQAHPPHTIKARVHTPQ